MRIMPIMAIFILSLSANAYAADAGSIIIDSALKANQASEAIGKDTERRIQDTQRTLMEVRSALMRYYTEKRGWPTDVNKLATEVDGNGKPYYAGKLKTAYGSVVGAPATGPNGSFFNLTVDMPNGASRAQLSKVVASRVRGSTTSSGIALEVNTPSSAIIAKTFLSRLPADASNPDANKMEADLNMAGHWLKNANLQGNQVDVTTLKTVDLNVTQDATISRNVNVGGALSVTGDSTFTGNVTHSGQVTVAKDLTVSQNLTSNGTFTANGAFLAKGASTFDGTVAFNKAATFNGHVDINGPLTVDGVATFTKPVTFNGAITSNGLITANGGITGTTATFQNANITNQLTAGSLVVNNDMTVANNLVVGKDIVSSGTIRAVNGEFSGYLTVTGLTTSGSVRANNGYYVGASNYLIADKDGNLYEKGVPLSQKYLGINDKAKDSDKLDGLDSTEFARLAFDNTYTGRNTFNGRVDMNGGLYAGGKIVVSADGNTLYEGGQALSSKYLGIKAKAADSDKLDGLDSTAFAKLGEANTFTAMNTFNAGINVNNNIYSGGTLIVSGTTLYDGGTALSAKYLGINAKAADSNLLDGIDSASFARRDANNVFTGANTFTQDINIAGTNILGTVNWINQRVTNAENTINNMQWKINEFNAWVAECRIDVRRAGCAIPYQ